MRHTITTLSAIAICILASCNSQPAATATSSMAKDSTTTTMPNKQERNKKVLMACMAGMNAHNVDEMTKDGASNFMDYGDGTVPPANLDSCRMILRGYLNAFPDLKGDNVVYATDGDYVLVYADWTGTFKNDFMGMKATGKPVKFKDVDVYKVDDNGKITEHRSIYPYGAVYMMAGVDMSKMMAPADGKDRKSKMDKKK